MVILVEGFVFVVGVFNVMLIVKCVDVYVVCDYFEVVFWVCDVVWVLSVFWLF